MLCIQAEAGKAATRDVLSTRQIVSRRCSEPPIERPEGRVRQRGRSKQMHVDPSEAATCQPVRIDESHHLAMRCDRHCGEFREQTKNQIAMLQVAAGELLVTSP